MQEAQKASDFVFPLQAPTGLSTSNELILENLACAKPSNKGARPALGLSDFVLAGHIFYWLVIIYLCMC